MNTFIRDLDEGIHRAIKVTAYARRETMNDFIVRAIKAAVAKDPFAARVLAAIRKDIRKKPQR